MYLQVKEKYGIVDDFISITMAVAGWFCSIENIPVVLCRCCGILYSVSFRQECVVKKNLGDQWIFIRQGALGCLKMQVFANNSKASNFEEKERPRYVCARG